MSNDPEKLRRALEDSGRVREERPTSYEELKEHYKSEYGQRGWIGAYAREIVASAKSGEKVTYGGVRRSIERYEAGTSRSSKYASETQRARVSASIPAERSINAPITLTLKGEQHDIRGGVSTKSDRSSKVVISPETATKIINGEGGWQDVWDDYGVDYDVFEDGDYEYAVSSVSAA